jgi:DNA-binding response OmpR family regulator
VKLTLEPVLEQQLSLELIPYRERLLLFAKQEVSRLALEEFNMTIVINSLLLVEGEGERETSNKLARSGLQHKDVKVARTLAAAINILKASPVELILLDLTLEDSQSLATLNAVRAVSDAVIIVLSDSDDELLGIEAIKNGGDDFLEKKTMTEATLRSSIVYSLIRRNVKVAAKRITEKIDQLSDMVGVK